MAGDGEGRGEDWEGDLKFFCVLTPSPLVEAILLGEGESVLVILRWKKRGVLVILGWIVYGK